MTWTYTSPTATQNRQDHPRRRSIRDDHQAQHRLRGPIAAPGAVDPTGGSQPRSGPGDSRGGWCLSGRLPQRLRTDGHGDGAVRSRAMNKYDVRARRRSGGAFSRPQLLSPERRPPHFSSAQPLPAVAPCSRRCSVSPRPRNSEKSLKVGGEAAEDRTEGAPNHSMVVDLASDAPPQLRRSQVDHRHPLGR